MYASGKSHPEHRMRPQPASVLQSSSLQVTLAVVLLRFRGISNKNIIIKSLRGGVHLSGITPNDRFVKELKI